MTDFKWIGSKVDCYNDNPLLQKGCFEYYSSFFYNGEEFQAGDFALFKQANKPDSTCIGRLLRVYQSRGGKTKYNGIVRWYTWAKNLQHKLNFLSMKFDEHNEVIEEMPSSATCVSLMDIKKKCKVICATLEDPIYLIKKRNLNPDIHFSCRYAIEHDQFVPYFSKDRIENINNEDYRICSELDSFEGNVNINECVEKLCSTIDSTFITDSSPLTKTTPIKASQTKLASYKKRKSSYTSPAINLDSEGSDGEQKYMGKVRSPSNPSKTLKLTPKSDKKKLSGSIKRNSSVKRVLNDSFDDHLTSSSGIPIYSYSIINSNYNDPKQIKMKFKLAENQNGINLKVFPTKLDNEIIQMKSPVKINDLQEIDNRVELSPNAKAKLLETKYETDSPHQVKSPYTPAQIGSTRRRSSRNIPRQSYTEYYSLETKTPIKRVRKASTDSRCSVTVKTPFKHVTETKITPLRKIDEDGDLNVDDKQKIKVKRHTEDSESSKSQSGRSTKHIDNKDSADSSSSDENDEPAETNSKKKTSRAKHQILERLTNTPRPKRSVSTPKRYTNNDNGSIIEYSTPQINHRPKRNVSTPKRYTNNDNGSNMEYSSPQIKHNSNNVCDVELSRSQDKTPGKTRSTKKIPAGNICTSVRKNPRKKLMDTDSEEDDLAPRTPKTTRQKSMAGAPTTIVRDTPTARARMIREGIITPSVQARNKAVVKDNTPLSKARTQLHVSFVPKSLPCREKEFANIINFLEGKLLDGSGGCMYVSGVPGTGKTATVTEVIRTLEKSVENGDLPLFKYVNINGMKLSEPRQSYVEIVRQLMGKTVHWEQAQTMLENRFVKSQKKAAPIILVVDELDILCTKRQDVVYNLLDWPTKANAQLIVITIANTMDLPERLLMGRVTSRLGLTRLTFQAYTHKQLQEIVSKRLSGISAFNPDAIQLVARKVASVSGDARRALDICRRAVEIAELEGKHSLVSMIHVNQALNAMITQPKVQAIKRCSRLEKLILQAVVAEVERTGVEETNFASVLAMLVPIAALDGFQMVSSTIAMAAISKLGACRLLLIDQKYNNIYQRIILNVSADDVYYALTKTDI